MATRTLVAIEDTVPAVTFTKPAFYNGAVVTNGIAPGANNFRGSFVTVPVRTLVAKVRVHVDTSSGNISAAIYTGNGATRLATTGGIACPGSNTLADLSLTASVTLDPGVYFVGVSADNGTATFYGPAFGQVAGAAVTTGSAYPAPTNVSADNNSAAQVPAVGLF